MLVQIWGMWVEGSDCDWKRGADDYIIGIADSKTVRNVFMQYPDKIRVAYTGASKAVEHGGGDFKECFLTRAQKCDTGS